MSCGDTHKMFWTAARCSKVSPSSWALSGPCVFESCSRPIRDSDLLLKWNTEGVSAFITTPRWSKFNLFWLFEGFRKCHQWIYMINIFFPTILHTSHYKLGRPELASCVAMARTGTRNFLTLSLLILLLSYASDKIKGVMMRGFSSKGHLLTVSPKRARGKTKCLLAQNQSHSQRHPYCDSADIYSPGHFFGCYESAGSSKIIIIIIQ